MPRDWLTDEERAQQPRREAWLLIQAAVLFAGMALGAVSALRWLFD